jgi:hypothetical protein
LISQTQLNCHLQQVEKIGVYTYGFDKRKELVPQNKMSNYFEITIVQPIDKERTPRNKKIIIKKNRAFFYEKNGEAVTTGLLTSLKKID